MQAHIREGLGITDQEVARLQRELPVPGTADR